MEYLKNEYGYVVDMLVGHSRGSVTALLWLCKHKDGDAKTLTSYVNVSGRYRMEVRFLNKFPPRCVSEFRKRRKHTVRPLTAYESKH